MKDFKKTKLTESDIIKKTKRWVNNNVILPSDVEDFIKMNEESPMSTDVFNDRLKARIRKRHLEGSVYLQNLGNGWEDDFERLWKNFEDYPKRMELLRSGSDRFGKNPVMYPLSKKDIAFSIMFWEQNYQKIETGKNQITLDLLVRLVAFYKIPADVILFGYHPFGKPAAENEGQAEKDRAIKDLRELVDFWKDKSVRLEEKVEDYEKRLGIAS